MAATKKARKKAAPGARRKRRGVTIEPVALAASELPKADLDEEHGALARQLEADGGAVIGAYREPLGGHLLLFVAVPIERVQPTPFQRDASDAHVRKLTRAMDKTRRFLDPVILVRKDDQYYTPNGNHRLIAMKELGARAIVGLLVPEYDVAYQILALNIEKAHNLRERALEVVRMYRDLQDSDRKESDFELEFEEPALVTLGFAYEQRGRLSGGAYHPALRKVDGWVGSGLRSAVQERERRAALVLELDDAVNEVVKKLKERGLTSPYLRSFVVARINPLRFIKGDPPGFDELLATMLKRARGFKVDKIGAGDVARTGGAAPDED
jgi:ParB family transcriptional regulator, chromosome partitioning protein